MTYERLTGIVIICALLGSFACSRRTPPVAATASPPAAEEVVAPAPPPPPPPAETAPPPLAALTEEELFARKTLEELNAERPLGDVFFDYDEWTIDANGRATLQQNADWLRRWTSTRITIEGHCDERGTSEYNLALGERRAHAAREYLVSLGIPTDRVLVVSKGEEAPACDESAESCWRQNRRAHSILTAK